MNKKHYIGLDVHKESIAIAHIQSDSRADAIFHGTCGGSNPAAERALRKLAKQLGLKLQDLSVCYEAEPTGFVLARPLDACGMRPTLPPRTSSKRGTNHSAAKPDTRR